MNDTMIDFVKRKLEEGEGIAPNSLAHILAKADAENRKRRLAFRPPPRVQRYGLLAASLAVAACGWFAHNSISVRRESDLTNVIALLQSLDDEPVKEGSPLAEALLAWQDAPSAVSND